MKRTVFSIFIAFLLLIQSSALVAALTLDKIGTSTVVGTISSWTYYGKNPTFVGTTDPSTAVSITYDGQNQSATADGLGNWSYTPTTLDENGSYPVTLNSAGNTISFTLNLTTASTSASTTTTSTTTTSTTSGQPNLPSELPQSGTAQETILLLAGGLGLVTTGVLFYWKVVPRLLFEESSDSADPSDIHLH